MKIIKRVLTATIFIFVVVIYGLLVAEGSKFSVLVFLMILGLYLKEMYKGADL